MQLTPDEVCTKHGLNNVNIDYTEENFRQWTSYKLYADHVRPMVLKENPKVSMTRLVQLIAAKWREFDSQNPYREQSHSAAKKPKEGTYSVDTFVICSRSLCDIIISSVIILLWMENRCLPQTYIMYQMPYVLFTSYQIVKTHKLTT